MKLKPTQTYDNRGRLTCAVLHCIQPAISTYTGMCLRHDPDERPVKKRQFRKAVGDTVRMDRLYFKRGATASERLRRRFERAGSRYADVALRAYHAGRL